MANGKRKLSSAETFAKRDYVTTQAFVWVWAEVVECLDCMATAWQQQIVTAWQPPANRIFTHATDRKMNHLLLSATDRI